MSASNEQVEVNTVSLSPEAADAFQRTMEVLGDNSTIVYLPEFEQRLKKFLSDHTIEDAVYGWDRPVELGSNEDLPTFPVDGLPETMRDMVQGVAEEKQISADLAAVLALATLAASQVGRTEVQVRPGWSEPVTLYVLGLAESGSRKSSTVSAITASLHMAQTELAEAAKETIIKAKAQEQVLHTRVKATERAYQRDMTLEKLTEYQTALEAKEAWEMPTSPVLVTTDATPEALVRTLKDNGERIAVFDAEGGGLSTMAGTRYSNNANIDVLLKGHAGDAISQTRVGSGQITIDNPMITIGILSQPETLRELVGVPGSKSRGLVDRFLIAAPPDNLGHRNVHAQPVPELVKNRYNEMLLGFIRDLWNQESSLALSLDEEADALLRLYQGQCEARRRPDGDLRGLGGFGSKLEGSAVRLAALHHLGHYQLSAFHYPITEVSMAWGIDAAEWSVKHYEFAVDQASEPIDLKDAQRILRWLRHRSERTQFIKVRDVQRGTRVKLAEDAKAALKLLADHNWVRLANDRKANGKDANRWEVHPALVGAGMDAV